MSVSQLILLVLLVLLAIYMIRLRSVLLDRFLMLIFIGIGGIAVLFPDLTTWIANKAGIGRGVDLVFYLFILMSLFFFIYIMSAINRLMEMITVLAREIAILKSNYGGEEDQLRENKPEKY